MAIPEDWELEHTSTAAEKRRQVADFAEYGMTDSLLDIDKELVSFRKGERGLFVSQTQPANGTGEAYTRENMLANNFELELEFAQMGWRSEGFDHPRRETVGGQLFYTSTAEISTPDRPYKFWMTCYEGIVGDRYPGVTMYYSTPQEKFELLDVWRGSVFRQYSSCAHQRALRAGGCSAEARCLKRINRYR